MLDSRCGDTGTQGKGLLEGADPIPLDMWMLVQPLAFEAPIPMVVIGLGVTSLVLLRDVECRRMHSSSGAARLHH